MEPRDQIGSPPPEWAPDADVPGPPPPPPKPPPNTYSPAAMRTAAAHIHDAAEQLDQVAEPAESLHNPLLNKVACMPDRSPRGSPT